MARGARTIEIHDLDSGYDIEVTLWVDSDGETTIDITTDGDEYFSVETALEIARSIRRLAKWAETPRGKKKIAQLRKKEEADMERLVLPASVLEEKEA